MPDQPAAETYELAFEWDRPPLTANQRQHWAAKARITRVVRHRASFAARQLRIPPLGRCSVALTWVVAGRRRRDADNLVPTLKALCDGLVDAGVVADDTPDLMRKHMPRIEYRPGATQHLVLTVHPEPSRSER